MVIWRFYVTLFKLIAVLANRLRIFVVVIAILGIPHSLRPQIWMRTSGALQKKLQSDLSYKDIVKNSSHEHLMTSKQIEKVSRL